MCSFRVGFVVAYPRLIASSISIGLIAPSISIAQELDFMDCRTPVASMFLPPLKIIDDVLIRYLLRPAGLEPTTFGSWNRVKSVAERCTFLGGC